jgi:hypothetical protein
MRFISKCDPNEFNLVGFLLDVQASPLKTRTWIASEEAKPGSFLFLGMSGADGGIYAISSILTAPKSINNPIGNPLSEDGVYRPAQWISDVVINKNLVHKPIKIAQMAKVPALAGLVRWFGQKDSFRVISDQESAALWSFMLPFG